MLTLGTGKLSENGEADYRSVQYRINGTEYKRSASDTEGTKTNFVAEPIIHTYKPDIIYILGTVKSVWHQFYASAVTVDNEDRSYMQDEGYLRLRDIQKNHDIHTSSEQLQQLGNEISDIYSKIDNWEKYMGTDEPYHPTVYILLTKYGVNSDELKENYDILKRIEGNLDVQCEYEVAFDITHSFRSLPIYNLVILNYIKNITRYNISIKHIYYGNIDARYELEGQAPIVDLQDLVQILDLTNGVAEFKDTGNAVTLIQMIDDNDPLKKVLEHFDQAMQLNAFDMVKCELDNLCQLLENEYEEDSRYTGVREMISSVLEEKFFADSEIEDRVISHLPDDQLRFLLMRWYFRQNRKGLGLATGLEALRDMITPAFVVARNCQAGTTEQHRINAETSFVNYAQALEQKPNRTLLEERVCELGIHLPRYKNIRNTFAHSLSGLSDEDVEEVYHEIDQFEEALESFRIENEKDPGGLERLFQSSLCSAITADNNHSCRVVLDFAGDCDYEKMEKIGYDVYYLKDEVRTKLIGGITHTSYNTTEKAYYMYQYLQNQVMKGYDVVYFILYECPNIERELIFRIFMEYLRDMSPLISVVSVHDGKWENCKQYKLCLDMDEVKQQVSAKEKYYSDIINVSLEKHV